MIDVAADEHEYSASDLNPWLGTPRLSKMGIPREIPPLQAEHQVSAATIPSTLVTSRALIAIESRGPVTLILRASKLFGWGPLLPPPPAGATLLVEPAWQPQTAPHPRAPPPTDLPRMRRIEKTTLASAMLIACCGACAPTPVRTVRGGEFSGWPKPVVRVLPEATDSALRRRESGFVVTRHVVDQTGRVVSVEVVDSSPDGVYERAVRAAIRQWRYESLEIDERVQSEPIGGVIVFCFPEDPCEFELPEGVEVIEFDPSALGPRR